MKTHWMLYLYRGLLHLYPPHFQAEFAEEMQSVFADLLEDACVDGPFAWLKLCYAELKDLPGAALRQRLDINRLAPAVQASWDGPPKRLELLAGIAVFLLPSVFVFTQPASGLFNTPWLVALGVLFSVVFIAGFVNGLPRWSLPYLGLVLSATSFAAVIQWVADFSAPAALASYGIVVQDQSALLCLEVAWAGLMWLGLFTLAFLVLGMLSLLRRFQPLLSRLRQDWTQFSYILYSGATLALVLAFDGYPRQQPFTLASALCLATGAWLFLHSSQRWQRGLALLGGLSLAMWTAAAGQWLLTPLQDWANWVAWRPQLPDPRLESQRTLLEWGWMVLVLLLPKLLASSSICCRREPSTPKTGGLV